FPPFRGFFTKDFLKGKVVARIVRVVQNIIEIHLIHPIVSVKSSPLKSPRAAALHGDFFADRLFLSPL
ncbi:hypothetical protein, partial [Pyramidobacter porci]|uniref:hypothetical protein n=1 Tax=Pyramidobacter porci TaxID=2605789 RepID=UPI002A7598F0